MKLSTLKGMVDIFPPEISYWQKLEDEVRKYAHLYSYGEIRTPILEKTELFLRGVGETTDIVNKEMYSFQDKGKRSVTMRPEGTASVVRSLIQHNLISPSKIGRYSYIGPMFRYERPQKGRQRQFHQFGMEAINSISPMLDVEIISIAMDIFSSIGLKNLKLKLNSVGCKKCIPSYKERLKEYFLNSENLCKDCQTRVEKNPLRILDCKNKNCASFNEDVPKREDYLCDECLDHFRDVKIGLETIKLPYYIDDKLVRGLDYYTKTAFEITTAGLGSQDSIGGGGRYDNLFTELGGGEVPSVGFASGMERVIIALQSQNSIPPVLTPHVYITIMSKNESIYGSRIGKILRDNNISTQIDLSFRKAKHQFKAASESGAKYTVIIGETEVNNSTVSIKNMEKRTQITLPINEMVDKITLNEI